MLNELEPQSIEAIDKKMIFQLLPCQLKYVFDQSKILGVEKGRQLGFTWISAYKILRKIFTTKRPFNTYLRTNVSTFAIKVFNWVNLLASLAHFKMYVGPGGTAG